jgi:serine/threonine protein kinase
MREIRILGEGAFGRVVLVEDPSTHELIAVKSFSSRQDVTVAFFREVESLARLVHPCVLRLVGFSLPTPMSPALIGTRFAANGSLKDVLTQSPRYDGTATAIIACGIVLGMEFIHSRGLMHRDLKPANVLIDERGFAQIGDLGSSRMLDLDSTLTSQVGTPLYKAPEMYDEGEYTVAVDVYAFALILYELLVGRYIFPLPIADLVLFKKVVTGVRGDLPDTMDAVVKDIITKCWAVEPGDRYSFSQIWRMFQQIKFKLTPDVDSDKVMQYVAAVENEVAELSQ